MGRFRRMKYRHPKSFLVVSELWVDVKVGSKYQFWCSRLHFLYLFLDFSFIFFIHVNVALSFRFSNGRRIVLLHVNVICIVDFWLRFVLHWFIVFQLDGISGFTSASNVITRNIHWSISTGFDTLMASTSNED